MIVSLAKRLALASATVICATLMASSQDHASGVAPSIGLTAPDVDYGQSSGGREAARIAGSVLDQEGKPVREAAVDIVRLGNWSDSRRTTTDDLGRFAFEALNPGVYTFIYPTDTDDYGEARLHRPGDVVTLKVGSSLKGGVITGTVTSTAGEPVVEAPVRAIPVRSTQGGGVRARFEALGMGGMTDDRGVYRIWGLTPGSYLIAAGGSSQMYQGPPHPYDDNAPTYYPSASLADAKVVEVVAGGELNGIDIRYRGDGGHSISGALIAPNTSAGGGGGFVISLTQASTGAPQAYHPVLKGAQKFTISNVPDGEYRLSGIAVDNNAFVGSSEIHVVKVSGADVTGADVVIAPLASISGKISWDSIARPGNPSCKPSPSPAAAAESSPAADYARQVSDIIVSLSGGNRFQDGGELFIALATIPAATPDDKGNFAIFRLGPGRYHLNVNLPNKDWYVSGISMPGPNGKPRTVGDEIPLKRSERLDGLAITISPGAAGLSGRVVSSAAKGVVQPRLRVYLVPAVPGEHESAGARKEAPITAVQRPLISNLPDPFRYREAELLGDGTFVLANVAPGQYILFAREWTSSDSPEVPRLTQSVAGRAKLVLESKDRGVAVDLEPCARVVEFVLKY